MENLKSYLSDITSVMTQYPIFDTLLDEVCLTYLTYLIYLAIL